MNREELKKLIGGPIGTVPTPFDAKMKVDYGVMADLTKWWVANGVVAGKAPIKVAAAMGEGPDLSDDEWPHLLRTVVNASGGKAAVICALQTKNTLHTIEDAKKAQDLGAIGLQIDLPIFHHPTQDDLVRYYTDISNAIDIGIMIYNTHWFGADSITAETMLRLADAEHVVGVKWSVPKTMDYDDMREFSHIFNVIDNSGQVARCHQNGGRGYISSVIAANPAFDLKIWELIEAHRYDEGMAMIERVYSSLAKRGKPFSRSGGYRQIKGIMAVMGLPVGPPRPPTLPMDDSELALLRDIMADWGWEIPTPNPPAH
ncbi:MAG: dihydrodipicolinate synthase family protein [Chloroflexi bacterium]|nr:dihydrodipicolinate synthase family protein [Chloroflexota bacterium]